MKELVTNGDNNEELNMLLNEHSKERIMTVGKAFSIRNQMVCNDEVLLNIDNYLFESIPH